MESHNTPPVLATALLLPISSLQPLPPPTRPPLLSILLLHHLVHMSWNPGSLQPIILKISWAGSLSSFKKQSKHPPWAYCLMPSRQLQHPPPLVSPQMKWFGGMCQRSSEICILTKAIKTLGAWYTRSSGHVMHVTLGNCDLTSVPHFPYLCNGGQSNTSQGLWQLIKSNLTYVYHSSIYNSQDLEAI